MEIVIIKDKKSLEKVFSIRRKVFIEEQLVSVKEEFDEWENSSTHFLVLFENIPIATARLRLVENKVKLERIAVLKEYRNKNFGRKLVEFLIEFSQINYNLPIYLYSQVNAIPFYNKIGFKEEGEIFMDANIEHKKMIFVNK